MPAVLSCRTVFMEDEQNIPLQLMCLFPWSSDGEAVLRNWNLWNMSLVWHTWSLKVPCLCSSSCFPAYSSNGTATCSLWHVLSHPYCHVVPVIMDWKALKLWHKKNKQQQQEKPFPLTLLLPEILSQWRGDCFIHCSHPPRLEPWCSRRCLSTALTMVTKSEYEKTGLTHTLHRLDIFCPSFVRHVKFKVSPTCWWYFKPLLLLEGSIGIYMPQIPTKKLQFLSSDDHKSLNQYI